VASDSHSLLSQSFAQASFDVYTFRWVFCSELQADAIMQADAISVRAIFRDFFIHSSPLSGIAALLIIPQHTFLLNIFSLLD